MQNGSLLMSSYSVAGLNLPNRIVLPPLVIWRSDESGAVNDSHREHYGRAVGPGLMIVEATTVSPEGRLAATQLGLWSDDHVGGLSDLAEIIHASGAMAGIQIHHAGNKAKLKHTYGEAPLVPSVIETSPDGAREMTENDIERVLEAFVAAVNRAIAAGFDYLELHGAHGYLMSQFLSPLQNHRTDTWGGSLENRMRFTLEAYRRAKDAANGRAVVGVRLGIADGKPGGIIPEDGTELARELVAEGCQILHVSHGGGMPPEVIPAGSQFSATMHLAGMVKAGVPATVIGVGGISTPDQAEDALREGLADLTAVGRAMLADPGWAQKAIDGNAGEIERCIDCKPRCFHFREPHRCPARAKLEKRGECPAPLPLG